jgi:two-component system sensor histidine kinase KdpD
MKDIDFKKIKGLEFILSAALTGFVTVLGVVLKDSLGPANFTAFFLLTVVLSAVWWGMAASVFSAIFGALAFDFFLVPPYHSFSVGDLKYTYILISFIITGVIVSLVASRSRTQAIEAKKREAGTLLLYRLSREMASCETMGQVIAAVRKNVGELIGCRTAVFLPEAGGMAAAGYDDGFPMDDNEKAVAYWAMSNKQPAGAGTPILSAAKALYVPLEVTGKAAGVLGVMPFDGRAIYVGQEMELLNALASQSSVAIQRARLADEAMELELAKKSQALQAALLNSISHDLRTPLVSITGALSTLSQDFEAVDAEDRGELLQTAYEDSLHLNEIVGNILDMTRVESGNLVLNIKPCDLRDLIGASLKVLKDKLENRKVAVMMPEGLFEIQADFTLMMRVFVNLLDNAVKYSPAGSEIIISAGASVDQAMISVKDAGFGIPGNDLEHIFDKFFRAVKPRQVSGTGLGLSICRGIVEAHGGKIWAQNNQDKGSVFFIRLPVKAAAAPDAAGKRRN